MESTRFSVFTATYNRANYLSKVYQSLVNQTFKDFEWIIVDDGSSDNTELIIKEYIKDNKVKNIKYIRKENEGKHTAWRAASNYFKGKYTITLDSDDYLTPRALEIFDLYWRELEHNIEYEEFWEVKARAQYEEGKLVGLPLPSKIFDSTSVEFAYKFGFKGDLHGCRKTAILQTVAAVPEKFIFDKYCNNFQESIRWFRAGKKYKTRYIEEVTEIVNTNDENRLSNPAMKFNQKHFYNRIVSSKYLIEENRKYMFKWDIKSYFVNIGVLLKSCFCLKINPFKILNKDLINLFFLTLMFIPIFILTKINAI